MRYAYILIQEEFNRPITKRNDFQKQILGVHGNCELSLNHFDTCIELAETRGFKVLRRDVSAYKRSEQKFPNERVAIVYMEHENKTLEYKVERYKITTKPIANKKANEFEKAMKPFSECFKLIQEITTAAKLNQPIK